jgi:hypothetical protein
LELILPQNAKLGTYNWTATISWGGEYTYVDAR